MSGQSDPKQLNQNITILTQAYEFPGLYPRTYLFLITNHYHSTFEDLVAAKIFLDLEYEHSLLKDTSDNGSKTVEKLVE